MKDEAEQELNKVLDWLKERLNEFEKGSGQYFYIQKVIEDIEKLISPYLNSDD